MQFREQGKKIQCIRSTYDPASKRSHQKVIAAFDRWADKLPSAGLDDLTDAERLELVAWFDARQAVKAERMNQYRAFWRAYLVRPGRIYPGCWHLDRRPSRRRMARAGRRGQGATQGRAPETEARALCTGSPAGSG